MRILTSFLLLVCGAPDTKSAEERHLYEVLQYMNTSHLRGCRGGRETRPGRRRGRARGKGTRRGEAGVTDTELPPQGGKAGRLLHLFPLPFTLLMPLKCANGLAAGGTAVAARQRQGQGQGRPQADPALAARASLREGPGPPARRLEKAGRGALSKSSLCRNLQPYKQLLP